MLEGKVVALGVTGGIAAYKACEIASRLVKKGADVYVVMTEHATNFVGPITFESITHNNVISGMFGVERPFATGHISLAKKADIFLIAPCTANMVAKLAVGIADDFLSTAVLAYNGPVVIAPAMNTVMYQSEPYLYNSNVLKKRGFSFVDSQTGRLACGDVGKGRLADVDTIIDTVCKLLNPKIDYRDKNILITCGATREPIDGVRYITNRSSGKMGIELAKAASRRGANVNLICGLCTCLLPLDPRIKLSHVTTTEEMFLEVEKLYLNADIIIMAAAPSDYKIKNYSNNKIKASSLSLDLEKTTDIAYEIGQKKEKRKLIIFSAETEELIENSKKKLIKKNADMVVANNVSIPRAGFDVDTNIASIITKDKINNYGLMSKKELAKIILDNILVL